MSQKPFVLLVGARGFEPPASWSRTKRATKLRYAPPPTYPDYSTAVLIEQYSDSAANKEESLRKY